MSNRISYNSIPQNGLVLDMPLNGNANARIGSNGSPVNMSWVDSEKGYTSKVGSFNGSSSYVTSTGQDFFGTQPFTISIFVKLNVLPSIGNILIGTNEGVIDSGIYDKGIEVLPTGQVRLYGYSGISNYATSSINIGIGQWYHLVGTYDGATLNIYVNGIQGTPTSCAGTYNFTNPLLSIATTNGATWTKFNGQIGLVKIYNRALSTEEIHNLKLEGDRLFGDKPNYPQLLRGLKAYYDFKGGSLSNLVDGTNATNNGATLTTDHLGRANNAYSFNGSSSYIQFPDVQAYKNTTSNISCYVKKISNPTSGTATIYSSTNYTSSIASGLWIVIGTTGLIQYYVWTGYNAVSTNWVTTTILDTNIHFIEIITTPTLLKTYMDGVLIDTHSVILGWSGSPNRPILGAYNFSGTLGGYFHGTISQLTIQNQALNASEVKELYNLTSKEYIYPFSKSSLLSLQKGLVMHLDSNGVDLSGNGNNGTPTAVTPTRRGQSEGGIYNGGSSKIVCPNINFTEYTINMFIKNTSPAYSLIIDKDIIASNRIFAVDYTTTNILSFHTWNNVGTYKVTTITIDLSLKNQMITFIWNNSNNTIKIYVDGVEKGSSPVTGTCKQGVVGIGLGSQQLGVNNFMTGNIYSPKIWNRALTPKEVEIEYYLNYIN